MSTHYASTREAIADRKWWLIDATNLPVGRLATAAARLLMGKNKPTWTPSVDAGDFVIIVNCEKVALSGRKETAKMYHHYTGYPGGMKSVAAGKMRRERPTRIVELAVCGMLPKTRLGHAMARKLKVVAGPDHPHVAQAPQTFVLRPRAPRPHA